MTEENKIELESLSPITPEAPTGITRRSFLGKFGRLAAGVVVSSIVGPNENSKIQAQSYENSISSNQAEVSPLPEFKEIERNQKVLVMMLKQKDKTAPITKEREMEIMQEVADFYHKSSFGKMNLTFEVLDWQDIDQDLNPRDPEAIRAQADSKLTQLDAEKSIPNNLHLEDFQTRLYLVDQTGKGSISGYGAKREPFNQAWIYQSEYTGGVGATKHELGHTLGLGHVNGYGCQEKGDYTNNCRVTNAASNSIMGNEYKSDIAAPQKFSLGWINSNQIQTVSKNADEIILMPSETDDQGKKILRIQKPDTNEFYYISYSVPNRQSYNPTLNFYIWDEKAGDMKQFSAVGSSDSKDGDEFYDKINGIQVKQLQHSNEDVTVSVHFK